MKKPGLGNMTTQMSNLQSVCSKKSPKEYFLENYYNSQKLFVYESYNMTLEICDDKLATLFEIGMVNLVDFKSKIVNYSSLKLI